MKKKTLFLLLAIVLVIGIAVGGTVAWLTAKTDSLVNTFTTSDVNITLAETEGGEDRQFKMVPGCTIAKDPKVTVLEGSETCWLFVKIDESDNFDDFMTYAVDCTEGHWTAGLGTDGIPTNVYYRKVAADDAVKSFDVLAGNTVTVRDTVTKEMMGALTTEDDYPTLTFTAYACQFEKGDDSFTPADAWTTINPTPGT